MAEIAPEQKSVDLSTKHFNFHKVFAAIGLILVGTIVVVFAALVYSGVNVAELFRSNIEEQDSGKIATGSSKPKATDSAKKDETADWKTYTSTTYMFSFKYPTDWE